MKEGFIAQQKYSSDLGDKPRLNPANKETRVPINNRRNGLNASGILILSGLALAACGHDPIMWATNGQEAAGFNFEEKKGLTKDLSDEDRAELLRLGRIYRGKDINKDCFVTYGDNSVDLAGKPRGSKLEVVCAEGGGVDTATREAFSREMMKYTLQSSEKGAKPTAPPEINLPPEQPYKLTNIYTMGGAEGPGTWQTSTAGFFPALAQAAGLVGYGAVLRPPEYKNNETFSQTGGGASANAAGGAGGTGVGGEGGGGGSGFGFGVGGDGGNGGNARVDDPGWNHHKPPDHHRKK